MYSKIIKTVNIIKTVFSMLEKKEKIFFFTLLFLILLNAIVETLGIAAIVPLITLILREEFLSKFSYLSNVVLFISQIVQPNSIYENNSLQGNLLVGGVVGFGIIIFFKTIFSIFLSFVQITFSNQVTSSIAKKLYVGYLNMDYIFHTVRNSTNLKQNILKEADVFSSVFNFFLIIISEVVILLFVIAFLLAYAFLPTITIFTLLFVFSYLIFHTTKTQVYLSGFHRLSNMEKRFKNVQEGLESIKEIYILQKSLYFIGNFAEYSKNFFNSNRNFLIIKDINRPLFELIGVIGLIILTLILFFKGGSMENMIATLGLFFAASFRLLPSLNKIVTKTQEVKFAVPSINRITQEFKMIKDNFKSIKTVEDLDFNKKIEFSNVTFFYPNKNIPALKNINFSIQKGKTFGIKGQSGSGKSTLINLFLTLIKPSEGQIKIDGINLGPNNINWLKNIGYVSQEVNLIDDTIEKNIAFGLSDEQIDYIKLMKSIKSSQLSTFIDSLEDGIKSRVGEKGLMISGGQKQRIGIARALYNNPDVLILDESTSSLDLLNEKLIMDTIHNLGKDKTIIIVSHRESALDRCDQLITISNGKIIEKNI